MKETKFKQTEIGMIPYDWEVKRLGDICIFVNGVAHENFVDDNGEYILVNSKFISSEGAVKKFSKRQLLSIEPNTVLMVMSDVPNGKAIAKCFLVPDNFKGTLNQRICMFTNFTSDVEYTYRIINRNKYYLNFDDGVKQTNLRKADVLNCPILLPPTIAEQQKIAKALNDVDNVISTLEKLITKKKNLKQGTMQQLLTGKKRLPGFAKSDKFKQTEIGEIPEDWEVKELSSLCTMITKQTGFDYSATIKPSLVTESSKETLSFIQNKDFEEDRINYHTDFYIPISVAKKFPRIYLDEDVLLISISGRIGNVAHFRHSKDAFIGGAVGVARFKDREIINFCMRYLLSPAGQSQIFANEKSGAQHNLTVADVRKLKIPIPSKPEQTAIANVLSSMDKEIEALNTKLEKYRNLKTGMMQQLLTGKIRLV